MEALAHRDESRAVVFSATVATALSELEQAIYSTVAYRDVFDFAPTVDEVHRYLHWIRCDRSELITAIHRGPLLRHHLTSNGELLALRGREELFELRQKRRRVAEAVWPIAVKYGRFLANLPHVRMVGVTGSLAADNFSEGADIDFLLLTDPRAMWRPRALARISALCSRKFGRKMLCPNIFLSMDTLKLQRQSLYDAQELAQMVPIFGRDAYTELRRANPWCESYLPNAACAPDEHLYFDLPPFPAVKKVIEFASTSPVGLMLENLEAARNIRRYNYGSRFVGWTKATRERHSLKDSVRRDIEAAWRRRVEGLAEPKV